MSSHKTESGTYFVLITTPDEDRRIFEGFKSPLNINKVLSAAAKSGIRGQHLYSGDNRALIANDAALQYLVQQGHKIVVANAFDELPDYEPQSVFGQFMEQHDKDELATKLLKAREQLEVVVVLLGQMLHFLETKDQGLSNDSSKKT